MELFMYQQVGLAILLASLVGLEREQKFQTERGSGFAGLRTFALIGGLGALSTIIDLYLDSAFIVITLGFLALVICSYVLTSKGTKDMGATLEVAAILAYLIGVLCGLDEYILATGLTIVMIAILHFKENLHGWAKGLKNKELIAGIQFIVIAFVILPLLPNQGFGPYEFFNPYVVWLMVVLISAISFASYVAVRLVGAKRGICFTGFLGGLISSTALTLSFAEMSKKSKTVVNPYVIAVLVASSAMFFRVLIEVAVVNRELLPDLILPMSVMGGAGILIAIFYWFFGNSKKSAAKVNKTVMKLKSPFNLWSALKFGAVFALVLLVVQLLNDWIGDQGVYLTSLVSGLMDVDAITLSMANLAKGAPEKSALAVNAIVLAAMTNTLAKGMFLSLFGGRKVAIRVLTAFLVMLALGAVALYFGEFAIGSLL